MTSKEYAHAVIENMSEEQLTAFLTLFCKQCQIKESDIYKCVKFSEAEYNIIKKAVEIPGLSKGTPEKYIGMAAVCFAKGRNEMADTVKEVLG